MKLSFRKLYSESRVDEACKREMYKTGDDECENKFVYKILKAFR